MSRRSEAKRSDAGGDSNGSKRKVKNDLFLIVKFLSNF
jgi:hypothetical protein